LLAVGRSNSTRGTASRSRCALLALSRRRARSASSLRRCLHP
jgi:hypothetical protein